VNFAINTDSEVYIHRAGRCGRNGNTGIMATIGDEVELKILQNIEKKLKLVVYPKVISEGKLYAPRELGYGDLE
jgi:superfamily II DNA/RNA helicase